MNKLELWPGFDAFVRMRVVQTARLGHASLAMASVKRTDAAALAFSVTVTHPLGSAVLSYRQSEMSVASFGGDRPMSRERFSMWSKAQQTINSLAVSLEVSAALWFIDHGYATDGVVHTGGVH